MYIVIYNIYNVCICTCAAKREHVVRAVHRDERAARPGSHELERLAVFASRRSASRRPSRRSLHSSQRARTQPAAASATPLRARALRQQVLPRGAQPILVLAHCRSLHASSRALTLSCSHDTCSDAHTLSFRH